MGADPRIGRDFLRAGVGYGGSCFPKDVAAFEAVARDCGIDFPLLREVAAGERGTAIAVCGAGADSARNPSGQAHWRAGAGVQGRHGRRAGIPRNCDCARTGAAGRNRVRPRSGGDGQGERERWELRGSQYAHDEYDAASGSDALLILTPWGQFGKLDLQRLRSVMKAAVIFDGRNLYAPEEMAAAGFVYHSVGRAVAAAIPAIRYRGHRSDRETPQQSNLAKCRPSKPASR